MAAANSKIGANVDIIPVDKPAMILVPAPVAEFSIIDITGFLPKPV